MLLEVRMDARNEEGASFTSIGKLGVSRRSYDRLYVNGTRFSSDPREFDRNFRRLIEIGKRHEQKIGRTVFRGLVSEDVVNHVLISDLKGNLEVVLPVGEFTGDNARLVYMARNKPGRNSINPSEYMARKASAQETEITSPLEKIKLAVGQGYVFTDRITEDQVDQVQSLWGETFGWKREEVDSLRKRLEADRSKTDPSKKDVWFSAVSVNGEIISAAMAERQSISGANGRWLDLVESTEWRVKDKYGGNGAMTMTLGALNAQILSDLKNSPNGTPLIFAECNFQSRADRAGKSAGFHIPERTVAPQILIQNVLVRDGVPVGEGNLRDFTFMYLPVETIQQHYSPLQLEAMKQAVKSQ